MYEKDLKFNNILNELVCHQNISNHKFGLHNIVLIFLRINAIYTGEDTVKVPWFPRNNI